MCGLGFLMRLFIFVFLIVSKLRNAFFGRGQWECSNEFQQTLVLLTLDSFHWSAMLAFGQHVVYQGVNKSPSDHSDKQQIEGDVRTVGQHSRLLKTKC